MGKSPKLRRKPWDDQSSFFPACSPGHQLCFSSPEDPHGPSESCPPREGRASGLQVRNSDFFLLLHSRSQPRAGGPEQEAGFASPWGRASLPWVGMVSCVRKHLPVGGDTSGSCSSRVGSAEQGSLWKIFILSFGLFCMFLPETPGMGCRVCAQG